MLLRLAGTTSKKTALSIQESANDYDLFENKKLTVFVYGYPFDFNSARWIKAKDIQVLFTTQKLGFLDSLEGLFSLIIFNREENKCYVISDRYGVYTLFYSRTGDEMLMSDVIEEMIPQKAAVQLNRQSIVEYLNFGFKVGGKTHFQDVMEFEDARIYEINRKLEMTATKYWDYFDGNKKDAMSMEALTHAFNKHISTAMKLEKKVSMPLTSGLDTRSIFSAMLPEKGKLHSYTHGVKEALDVQVAGRICRHFEVPHNHYTLDEKWVRTIPEMLEENAGIFNGLIPALNFLHVINSYRKEKSQGNIIFSGSFGNEIWRCWLGRRAGRSAAAFSKVEKGTALGTICEIIVKRCMNENARPVDAYAGMDTRGLFEMLESSVKEELSHAKEGLDGIRLAEYFILRNICGNIGSAQLRATGKYFKVISALLHRNILQQIPLLSLRTKAQGKLQKMIIAKNSDYLASIPLSSGQHVNGGVKVRLKCFHMTMSKYFVIAVNILSRRILKTDLLKVGYFQDYGNWMRDHHKTFLSEILNYDSMITKDLFDRAKLQLALDQYLKGDNGLTGFFVNLISLENWLKHLINHKQVTLQMDLNK